MKKQRCALASVLMLASLVFSLHGSAAAATQVAQATRPPVTINVFLEGVPDQRIISEMLPEFEAKTGIKVKFEILSYSVMREKILPQLAASRNSYDVIIVDKQWVGEFVYAGWLEDLGPYVARTPTIDTKKYIPSLFKIVGELNGKTWMLPYYNYTAALLYRKDQFEDPKIRAEYKAKTGKDLVVPTNLDDYVQVAKFFTKPQENMYGVVMELARGVGIHKEWSPLFFGLGGYYFDKDWNPTVNSEAGVKALRAVLDLYRNASPPGATSYKFDDAFAFMSQGRAAMYITYNWMLPRLNDPKQSGVAGKVALAKTPGGVAHQGAWGWAIPKNAPNKEEAWKFISWVESFEVAKRRALMGGSPTRADVLEDKDVLAKYPHYTLVKEILANAVTVPIYLGTAQQYDIVSREFSAVVAQGKDPKVALDDLNKGMADLIKEDPLVKQYKSRR